MLIGGIAGPSSPSYSGKGVGCYILSLMWKPMEESLFVAEVVHWAWTFTLAQLANTVLCCRQPRVRVQLVIVPQLFHTSVVEGKETRRGILVRLLTFDCCWMWMTLIIVSCRGQHGLSQCSDCPLFAMSVDVWQRPIAQTYRRILAVKYSDFHWKLMGKGFITRVKSDVIAVERTDEDTGSTKLNPICPCPWAWKWLENPIGLL